MNVKWVHASRSNINGSLCFGKGAHLEPLHSQGPAGDEVLPVTFLQRLSGIFKAVSFLQIHLADLRMLSVLQELSLHQVSLHMISTSQQSQGLMVNKGGPAWQSCETTSERAKPVFETACKH